jgi:hypothetical protein
MKGRKGERVMKQIKIVTPLIPFNLRGIAQKSERRKAV